MADALVNIASLGPFLTHLRADEAPDLNIMFRIQETTLPAAASASPLFATAVETVGDPHRLGDEDFSSMTPFTQSKSLWPVPTVSVLIGDDEPPHNHRCSLVPLARLLKKDVLGCHLGKFAAHKQFVFPRSGQESGGKCQEADGS